MPLELSIKYSQTYGKIYIIKEFKADEKKIMRAMNEELDEKEINEWNNAFGITIKFEYKALSYSLHNGEEIKIIDYPIMGLLVKLKKESASSHIREYLCELLNYFFPVVGSMYSTLVHYEHVGVKKNIVRITPAAAALTHMSIFKLMTKIKAKGVLFVEPEAVDYTILYYALHIVLHKECILIVSRDMIAFDDEIDMSPRELIRIYSKLGVKPASRYNPWNVDLAALFGECI